MPDIEEEHKKFTYRRQAIEKLIMADQVDQPFLPVKTHPKLIWIGMIYLLFCFIVWLFVGSLPIIVFGKGIIINAAGLYTIEAKSSGIVTSMLVKPGDQVQKGELVAEIENFEDEVKYKNALENVSKLKKDLAKLKNQVGQESLAAKSALQKQIESSQITINELQKTIETLEKDLTHKEELFKQQLIGLNELKDSRQLVDRYKIELETTKATQATLLANIKKMYRLQELKEKERAIIVAEHEAAVLKLALDYSKIYSPDAGKVLELVVNKGDNVQPGSPLMHLEYTTENKTKPLIYGFVPISDGKKIRKGNRVEIEPSTVSAHEYGTMRGTVVEISPYGISKENLERLIQNENLVNFLFQREKSVTQIVIDPLLDPHTISGFKWSSGKGPPVQISTGTVCQIRTIAGRMRPALYFFSFWRLEHIKNKVEDFFGIGHHYYKFED